MNKTFTRMAAALFASIVVSAPAFGQTATVYLNQEKQLIQGFGGMNHPAWQGYDLTSAQIQKLYGNGDGELGFSILRIWVDSNTSGWSRDVATPKAVQNLGGIVFATPWNPPTDMVETVSRNGRSEKRLKYSSYAAYAEHLKNFNNYMKQQGVSLYAMSFANEPDYGFDWTWYSADEVYNFTKNYAGSLRINGTKVISAESFSYNKSMYDKILDDASALSNIDIIGAHFYASNAGTSNTFFQYAKADQKAANKERWMTEHYTSSDASSNPIRANCWPEALNVSYEIHRAMVEGNFNAYVWWYLRRDYGPMAQNDGAITKRGYLMGQFSKFVRPGFVRVNADKNPTTDVYVSAYKKDNEVVIVAVNRSISAKTITFSIPEANASTWSRYVTTSSKNIAKESDIASSNTSFNVTLEAQSTTTFVGNAPSGYPSVKMAIPANDTILEAPAKLTLTANASDKDGQINKVEFYNGNEKIGEATSAPYSFNWENIEEGSYSITAVATDNEGQSSTSAAIKVTVNVPQGPFEGIAQEIPGIIEVEKYDVGGAGMAYSDNEAENKGGFMRKDEVDIVEVNDGYGLGYTMAGEWLEYTVNVKETGVYSFEADVAQDGTSGAFHLSLDNVDITDNISVPNTNGFDVYQTIKGSLNTRLEAGTHILKLTIDGSYFNIDKIRFVGSENTNLDITDVDKLSLNGNYMIINLLGESKGTILFSEGNNIKDRLSEKIKGSGIYILKSLEEDKSYIINHIK
ncbi:MAG TPA: carbohydrate-binding protein [Paludibacteraceae bacterium]|nr:carbohydrate-binding protein [Paludibacteraceae bacterium]HPH63971.1 carbohydrate-binding protein [Paludibacteraceae bacterium]